MSERSYSALMLDLDGTLIDQGERTSPRVHRAVTLAAQHLRVSIVSGREVAQVSESARALSLTDPQVSDGGAHAFDPVTGRSIWTAPLDPDDTRMVAAAICESGGDFFATFPGGKVQGVDNVRDWNLTRISALDLDEEGAERLQNLLKDHKSLNTVKAYLPYNDLWAVDFTLAGVDKGTALTRLAGIFGLEPKSTIAVGDSHNDLPMLKTAGLKVVMGRSPEELTSLADYIAPPVEEDGLAVAIEEFIMPRVRM